MKRNEPAKTSQARIYEYVITHVSRVDAFVVIFTKGSRDAVNTGWPRPIGCLVFIGHFPQKSPVISGSLATNDLQLVSSQKGHVML